MNNERYNQIIDEAYENYSKSLIDSITFSERYKHFRVDGLEFNSGYPNYIHFTKEEFINKCITDIEFSERWELKIEERELTLEERYNKWFNNNYETGMERYFDLNDIPDFDNSYYEPTPTKVITVTYQGEKIEVYE